MAKLKYEFINGWIGTWLLVNIIQLAELGSN